MMLRLIDQVRQNRPSLIADDLEQHGVPRDQTMKILLSRGVFKWSAARRELIRLKDEWRRDIAEMHLRLNVYSVAHPYSSNPREIARVKARLKALTECREAVRRICRMPRLSAPDNDWEAMEYLSRVVTGRRESP